MLDDAGPLLGPAISRRSRRGAPTSTSCCGASQALPGVRRGQPHHRPRLLHACRRRRRAADDRRRDDAGRPGDAHRDLGRVRAGDRAAARSRAAGSPIGEAGAGRASSTKPPRDGCFPGRIRSAGASVCRCFRSRRFRSRPSELRDRRRRRRRREVLEARCGARRRAVRPATPRRRCWWRSASSCASTAIPRRWRRRSGRRSPEIDRTQPIFGVTTARAGAGRFDRAAPLQPDPARHVRRVGAAAGADRHLRRDRVRGGAADARDRRPHGARRAAAPGRADGGAAGDGDRVDRHRAGDRGGAGAHPRARQPALRGDADRSGDVRRRRRSRSPPPRWPRAAGRR